MSRQQREALEVVLRAEPFDLNQTPEQHRKSFDAFVIKPYPADVTEQEMILGGVRADEPGEGQERRQNREDPEQGKHREGGIRPHERRQPPEGLHRPGV